MNTEIKNKLIIISSPSGAASSLQASYKKIEKYIIINHTQEIKD